MNFGLLSSSHKIMVALSGGKDSSAALQLTIDYCAQHKQLLDGGVIINHNLRTNSTEEAQKVAQYWQQKGIKISIIHWKNPIGNQKKAREFRLLQLALYAHRHQVDTVVLGHNLQDKIETYLMRRGKSTFWGLAAIAPMTYIYGIKFVRPLLSTSIEFIKNFISTHKIPVFEDPTNSKDTYTRNTLRHHIIPSISVRETLLQMHTAIGEKVPAPYRPVVVITFNSNR